MGTLVITQNMSADGAIELIGEWFDPRDQDPELTAELMRQSKQEQIMLLGRRTFEDFRSYWPHQTDDPTGIAAQLDRVHKVVVSPSMAAAGADPGWANTTVLGDDWLDRVRELVAEDSSDPGDPGDPGDIVVTGSITLCHALIEAELVREYRIFTYPTIQGGGRRLFPDGHEAALRLVEVRSFDSGVTLTIYQAA